MGAAPALLNFDPVNPCMRSHHNTLIKIVNFLFELIMSAAITLLWV